MARVERTDIAFLGQDSMQRRDGVDAAGFDGDASALTDEDVKTGKLKIEELERKQAATFERPAAHRAGRRRSSSGGRSSVYVADLTALGILRRQVAAAEAVLARAKGPAEIAKLVELDAATLAHSLQPGEFGQMSQEQRKTVVGKIQASDPKVHETFLTRVLVPCLNGLLEVNDHADPETRRIVIHMLALDAGAVARTLHQIETPFISPGSTAGKTLYDGRALEPMLISNLVHHIVTWASDDDVVIATQAPLVDAPQHRMQLAKRLLKGYVRDSEEQALMRLVGVGDFDNRKALDNLRAAPELWYRLADAIRDETYEWMQVRRGNTSGAVRSTRSAILAVLDDPSLNLTPGERRDLTKFFIQP